MFHILTLPWDSIDTFRLEMYTFRMQMESECDYCGIASTAWNQTLSPVRYPFTWIHQFTESHLCSFAGAGAVAGCSATARGTVASSVGTTSSVGTASAGCGPATMCARRRPRLLTTGAIDPYALPMRAEDARVASRIEFVVWPILDLLSAKQLRMSQRAQVSSLL